MIYQKVANSDPNANYLIHDGNEYEHAFSVAADLILGQSASQRLVFPENRSNLALDLVYECYKVYCVKFNLSLIEKPDLLYNMRKNFSVYREILNDLQILLGKFSYDYNISREYVISHLNRILNSLKSELLKLTKKAGKGWEFLASVSFFNIPVGQLIRLLVEKKVSEKVIQKRINDFFSLYENKSWKNLFVMLKSFEDFRRLDLTEGLTQIDTDYFKVRPDWWIDYLPWYEGGTKFIMGR